MRILGLYLDPPYLSIAILETKGKTPKVCFLKSLTPATAENVKQIYIQEKPGQTAVALPTLVRTLQFTISSSKQIAQILPFQVESLTSMSLKDIVYSGLFSKMKEGVEATIFLVSKESLIKSLDEWKSHSIIPDQATSTFSALVKFAQEFLPDLSSAFIIDLGSQKLTCVWLENKTVKKGFTIDLGVESLLSALWEDLKKVLFQKEIEGVAAQLDLLQLKAPIHPNLSNKLQQLRNALSNVLYSLQKESGPKPILFTGRIDAFAHLRETLLEQNPELSLIETKALSPESQKCAVAIGCALEKDTQLLKNEFTPQKAWQKAGSHAALLMLASISLTIAILFGGHLKFQSEKESIAYSFKKVLLETDKSLANSLFIGNIENGIEEAALAIQKYDKETPYIPQVPNVTEVLAWISAHPLIEALLTTDDPLEIIGVKYQLVSYPHIDAMKESYKAKVDLEFSVKSPMSARKFHEALLADEAWVNSQEDFFWDSSGDTYRTSFFVKKKAKND